MKPKFIIQVGQQHYGCGFHVNSRTVNNWPNSFLTDNINEARIFNNFGTAKAMAGRLHSVLLEWVKNHPKLDYRLWGPICVVEVDLVPGSAVVCRTPILEDLI